MNRIACATQRLEWQNLRLQLDQEGFAVLPGFLGHCARSEADWREKSSGLLSSLEHGFYPALAQVANQWNELGFTLSFHLAPGPGHDG